MKFLKIAVLSIVLPLVLMMGGCATVESTVTGFEKVSSFEIKKVALSLPVVVEKDMETKKNPDATEKAVADEVYAKLKENLNQKGLLTSTVNKDSASFSLDLQVHYVSRYSAGFEYSTTWHPVGGQIIMTRINLRKNNAGFAQIDSFNNTGTLWSRDLIVRETVTELASQIEKILKEGVNVGKSP